MSGRADRIMDCWAWVVATGLGSGWLRPASGTWGSGAALILWVVLRQTLAPHLGPGWWAWVWGGLVPTFVLGGVGVWAADRVARLTGTHDPSFIVIDEWVGQWVALLGLPFAAVGWMDPWPLLAFVAFRFFDVWKPGLVDDAQRLPGGWGIVLDDVLAGGLAALVTAVVRLGVLGR